MYQDLIYAVIACTKSHPKKQATSLLNVCSNFKNNKYELFTNLFLGAKRKSGIFQFDADKTSFIVFYVSFFLVFFLSYVVITQHLTFIYILQCFFAYTLYQEQSFEGTTISCILQLMVIKKLFTRGIKIKSRRRDNSLNTTCELYSLSYNKQKIALIV